MSTNPPAPALNAASPEGPAPRTFLGHPVGLYVLFFTELWERFSFYGMKTLLMLYMTNSFVWSQEKASAHMGWYTMLAYALPVLGGFVADRYLGAWRATFLGGVLLAIGHFLMAFEPLPFFYSALAFIVAGVGLLKPNISTQVGSLYAPGDPRRDGAFTIFYMGINLGAMIGPLLCDWLRVRYGYHYGFGAAGVGMVLGLIIYILGRPTLVARSASVRAVAPTAAAAAEEAAPHVVRDRLIVLVIIFAFVVLFWMAFEQSSNVLLIWADKHTNLRLFSTEPPPMVLDGAAPPPGGGGLAAFEITSGQTQSFNPFFIIALAPLFAFCWLWLERRGLQPSTPTKMVLGLAAVVVAYGVMWPAAHLENGPSRAPLAEVPAGVRLEEFGATRLRYDPATRSLEMNGVLPDLDRLRLLAQAAPPEIASAVDSLAKQAAAQARQGRKDWSVSVSLPTAPADYRVTGLEAPKAARWDLDTRTLSATRELSDRVRLELLAPAAPAEFRSAVDAIYINSGRYRVSVWWLVLFFLVITMGELCLSPVGLSLVTKLAPPKHVGLLMGGWFLSSAIAGKAAHFLGGFWGRMPPLHYFMMFLVICAAGALVMALLVRPMKRMMHGVK